MALLLRIILGWFCLTGTALLPAGTVPPEIAIPYGNNPAAGAYAEVNGIKLYYETYGQGAPLVVLHGNGGSIEQMRYQIDHFRATRRVIAVDSRGHGHSGMGAGRLTYEQIADDVAALLAQLHAGPADLIGWSDGGIVALQLALRHPASVHRIVLSGANLVADALQPGDFEGMKAELAQVRQKLAAHDPTQTWAIHEQQLLLMIEQTPITAADLVHITCPALVLAGEHDMIPEPHTRSIAAGLPHARLHIFAGASHGALQEVPAEFNHVIADFFAETR